MVKKILQLVPRKRIRKLVNSNIVSYLIRMGYFIRGILYCLIGAFAFSVSIGLREKSANQNDAISFIHSLPFGYFTLIILAVGLVGYSLWGFIRASQDYLDQRTTRIPFFKRIGYIMSGLFYGSLISPTMELIGYTISNSDPYTIQELYTGLLQIPFGRLILFGIGAIGYIAGILQIHKAIKAKSPIDVDYTDEDVAAPRIFMLISKTGIAVRGLLWIIIGTFAIIADIYIDPSRAKGTTEALDTLPSFPFGHIFLSAIAGGIMLFGIYSISLSFWVALPNHK